jgi:hypothetical protein
MVRRIRDFRLDDSPQCLAREDFTHLNRHDG